MKHQNYFDWVDWEKLLRESIDKAIREEVEHVAKGNDAHDLAYVTSRAQYWYDYIWLMGPVPMKEGWIQPTF